MMIFSKEERFRLRALMTVRNSWEERLFLKWARLLLKTVWYVNSGHASMCLFNGWSLLCVSLISFNGLGEPPLSGKLGITHFPVMIRSVLPIC